MPGGAARQERAEDAGDPDPGFRGTTWTAPSRPRTAVGRYTPLGELVKEATDRVLAAFPPIRQSGAEFQRHHSSSASRVKRCAAWDLTRRGANHRSG